MTNTFSYEPILDDGRKELLVFAPDGSWSTPLSLVFSAVPETGIAVQTVPGYLRGVLCFLDQAAALLGSTCLEQVFGPAPTVQHLMQEAIRKLGGSFSAASDEVNVWHVTAPAHVLDLIAKMICGTVRFYSAAIAVGLYRHEHPLEIPPEHRQRRVISCGSGQGQGYFSPRFRFRLPAPPDPALRCDDSSYLPLILPALTSFGAPPSVVAAMTIMIDGLARISEQLRLTIWDWWTSHFGLAIATPNKGDGETRTKDQYIGDRCHAFLTRYCNEHRPKVALDGWTLDQWSEYLRDPRVPVRERQERAAAAPLIPTARGGFFTRSGFVDTHYAPAMRAAGLPTRTHYPRHCGINDFLAWVRQLNCSEAQRDTLRLLFARSLGWKWPLVMLARYSLPDRRATMHQLSQEWLQNRASHSAELSTGLGSIARAPQIRKPAALKRFVASERLAA